jgi:hypothetical protein
LVADGASSQAYNFTDKGITWKNEYKKYTNKPPGNPSDYLPPPNWAARYPDGYTEFPQLASDEHFQVWMKISALPTFTKLWGRNDNEVMRAGTYQVVANMSEYRSSTEANDTHGRHDRLPGPNVRRHQVNRNLYRFVDRRQATFPGMVIRCRISHLCLPGHCWYRQAHGPTEKNGRHVEYVPS